MILKGIVELKQAEGIQLFRWLRMSLIFQGYIIGNIFHDSELCFTQSYSYVTGTSWWAWWRLRSPASPLFTQPFIQTQIKENIKLPRHWPLCGKLTGDRWIPRTKGPVTRKMFPFDDVILTHSSILMTLQPIIHRVTFSSQPCPRFVIWTHLLPEDVANSRNDNGIIRLCNIWLIKSSLS